MRIRKQTEAKWFDFIDDPDGGRVKMRQLKPSEEQSAWTEAFACLLEELPEADQQSAPFMARVSRKMTEINTVKAVAEWENFFDENGEPLECNEDNILLVMHEIAGCYNTLVVFRNDLEEINDKAQEAQEKN
jgi:hypothetical protein